MTNPFERFYDTELDFYSLTDGGYSNGDTKIYLGSLVCDLQPYRAETDSEVSGLETDRLYKLYADKSPLIKTGNLVCFGGAFYRIVSDETWSFGMTAIMRCVENES